MEPPRIPFKNEEGWSKTYRAIGALHIPEREAGNVLVHLGKREKTTFDSSFLANDHSLMRMSVCDLVLQCLDAGGAVHTISRVVGSIPLAEFVASELGHHKSKSSSPWETRASCKALPFEEAVQIGKDEVVLVVEDCLVSDSKSDLVGKIARQAGATVFPFIFALVNLSGRGVCPEGKILCLVGKVD
jgi:hypothetical protein